MFHPIIAFVDDTENFPLGNLRAEYEPNYLKRLDEKTIVIIDDYKQDILTACREILQMFPEQPEEIE